MVIWDYWAIETFVIWSRMHWTQKLLITLHQKWLKLKKETTAQFRMPSKYHYLKHAVEFCCLWKMSIKYCDEEVLEGLMLYLTTVKDHSWIRGSGNYSEWNICWKKYIWLHHQNIQRFQTLDIHEKFMKKISHQNYFFHDLFHESFYFFMTFYFHELFHDKCIFIALILKINIQLPLETLIFSWYIGFFMIFSWHILFFHDFDFFHEFCFSWLIFFLPAFQMPGFSEFIWILETVFDWLK